MQLKQALGWLSTMALLVGCQTVDDSKVTISPELNSRATMYSIQQPMGFLTADQYQQQLGDLHILNVDISGTRTTTTPIYRSVSEWSHDVANAAFLFLVFDIRHNYPGFDERNQQLVESRFRFDIEQAGIRVHTECRRLVIQTQTVYQRDSSGDAIDTSTARDQARLGCVFTEQGQISELLVSTVRGKAPSIRLRHAHHPLSLTPLRGVQMLVGGQWQAMPMFGAVGLHGLSIADQGTEQAAVSLFGTKNKLWLDKTVAAERQRLLVAAGYSLILYSWTDDEWLMAAASDTADAAQSPVPWH